MAGLRNEEAASVRAASSHLDRTPSFPPVRGDGGDEPENGRSASSKAIESEETTSRGATDHHKLRLR